MGLGQPRSSSGPGFSVLSAATPVRIRHGVLRTRSSAAEQRFYTASRGGSSPPECTPETAPEQWTGMAHPAGNSIGERYLADTIKAAVAGRRPQIRLAQKEAEEILDWLRERVSLLRRDIPSDYRPPWPFSDATAESLESEPEQWAPYMATVVSEMRDRARGKHVDAGQHNRALSVQLLAAELAMSRLLDGLTAAGTSGLDGALEGLLSSEGRS